MILGIYCAGGFGGVAYGLAKTINERENLWTDIIFIDDEPDVTSNLTSVISFSRFIDKFSPDLAEVVIGSGEPRIRESLFDKVKQKGYKLPNLIHPMADAHTINSIGEGNIILTFAYISSSKVTIGNNNIIMPFSQISHNNEVGSHCVIATSANISGTTVVHDRAYIAVGSKLREGITIGYDAIVGMGAIVTKSVENESVVMGMPAKEVRKNNGSVFAK